MIILCTRSYTVVCGASRLCQFCVFDHSRPCSAPIWSRHLIRNPIKSEVTQTHHLCWVWRWILHTKLTFPHKGQQRLRPKVNLPLPLFYWQSESSTWVKIQYPCMSPGMLLAIKCYQHQCRRCSNLGLSAYNKRTTVLVNNKTKLQLPEFSYYYGFLLQLIFIWANIFSWG